MWKFIVNGWEEMRGNWEEESKEEWGTKNELKSDTRYLKSEIRSGAHSELTALNHQSLVLCSLKR